MDILSGSYPGEIYFFRRKPNNTFAAGEILKHDGKPIKVGQAACLSVADWNGDGLQDLFIGTIDGAVFYIPNQGTTTKPAFGPAVPLKAAGKPVSAQGGRAGTCVGDWDGDGKLDLLLGNESGSVVWYRNSGTKTKPELAGPVTLIEPAQRQAPAASLEKPTRSGLRSKVAVVDWNGDGRPDLLVGDFQSGGQGKYHGWVWVYLRKAADAMKTAAGQ